MLRRRQRPPGGYQDPLGLLLSLNRALSRVGTTRLPAAPLIAWSLSGHGEDCDGGGGSSDRHNTTCTECTRMQDKGDLEP